MKVDFVVGALVVHKQTVLLIHHNKLDMWLPPGGHIDPNEIPDDAVVREVKEETNLDVELVPLGVLPKTGLVKRACIAPFNANVHSVGDHDHYVMHFLCTLSKGSDSSDISMALREIKDAQWFSKEELIFTAKVTQQIKDVALAALNLYNEHNEKVSNN